MHISEILLFQKCSSVGEPVDLSWVFQGKFVKFVEEALYVLQNQIWP